MLEIVSETQIVEERTEVYKFYVDYVKQNKKEDLEVNTVSSYPKRENRKYKLVDKETGEEEEVRDIVEIVKEDFFTGPLKKKVLEKRLKIKINTKGETNRIQRRGIYLHQEDQLKTVWANEVEGVEYRVERIEEYGHEVYKVTLSVWLKVKGYKKIRNEEEEKKHLKEAFIRGETLQSFESGSSVANFSQYEKIEGTTLKLSGEYIHDIRVIEEVIELEGIEEVEMNKNLYYVKNHFTQNREVKIREV